MALCLVMISCPNQTTETKKVNTDTDKDKDKDEDKDPDEGTEELLIFEFAPALQLISVNGGFAYSWQDSDPPADSVDLHWRVSQAPVDSVNLIWEFGYVRKNVQIGDTIAVSLRDDEFFSAFIIVHKDGYASAYSNVVIKQPVDVFTDREFDYPPVLYVTPGAGSLICRWDTAYPFPGSYDLYYVEGNFTSAARVKADGIRIRDCVQPDSTGSINSLEYTIEFLDSSKIYSVVVTAERMGYRGIDSAVRANQQPQ